MRALSLTDAQYRLIHEAAKPIPIEWRDRFLNSVADRLIAVDVITNDDVSEAVHTVLARMFGKVSAA